MSWDDGERWQKLQLGLPVVPITDLEVHGNELVAATQGRAFWVLDDLGPLRSMNDDVATSDLFLFASPPAYLDAGSSSSR